MIAPKRTRILKALSDRGVRATSAVCKDATCSQEDIASLAHAGFVRFTDVGRGGRMVCITPKGLYCLKGPSAAHELMHY